MLIVVFVTTGGKLVFIVSLLGGGLLIKGSALICCLVYDETVPNNLLKNQPTYSFCVEHKPVGGETC